MPRRKKIPPETQGKLLSLDVALQEAMAAGAKPDEVLRHVLSNEAVFSRIFNVHLKAAMAGSVQSSKWLFDRGFGTASQTVQHTGQVDLRGIFGDPLESADDLYEVEGEEQGQIEP